MEKNYTNFFIKNVLLCVIYIYIYILKDVTYIYLEF